MAKKPNLTELRKQQAYEQGRIQALLNQSEIFRRQFPDLQACFPGWRIMAVRDVK